MSSSTSPILSKLFSVGTINAITGGARGGGKRAGYVAEKYARQLEDLMRTLRSSQSHFVRCVKPNHQQEPNLFVNELVLSHVSGAPPCLGLSTQSGRTFQHGAGVSSFGYSGTIAHVATSCLYAHDHYAHFTNE